MLLDKSTLILVDDGIATGSAVNGQNCQIRMPNSSLGSSIYIADPQFALQAEFGLGDASKLSGQMARAVAAYSRIYGIWRGSGATGNDRRSR